MTKPTLTILIMIFAIVALSGIRVVVSNSISTSGIMLDEIGRDSSYYKTQNAILKEKLLSITSFEYIASKASEMGFSEGKGSVSLSKPLPLAIKQ